MPKLKFTKATLDNLLEEVLEAYFEDDNTVSLGECIDFVKQAYKEEISTLEDGPTWISGKGITI